jgi:hypothetical protein
MICRICKENKDEENFSIHKKRPDGSITKDTRCKPCRRIISKKHYNENKEIYFSRDRKKERELRKFINEYKEKCECTRCGLSGKGIPEVMDFRTKETEINKRRVSQLMTYSKKILLEAISKCDVYCANCQRIINTEANHGIRTPKKH